MDATTPGVSSLQSVMAASQTSNRLNLLTPSLAKFFRPDLISHVTNWPAEILEKQVNIFKIVFIHETYHLINFAFYRRKSVPRKCICWVIWNVAKYLQRFNAPGVSLEWLKSQRQFKHKGLQKKTFVKYNLMTKINSNFQETLSTRSN